jgi:hypothetical protein
MYRVPGYETQQKGTSTYRYMGSGEGVGRTWEVDFTEVKPGRYGYRYLLVLIHTFSGWVEAFPTK